MKYGSCRSRRLIKKLLKGRVLYSINKDARLCLTAKGRFYVTAMETMNAGLMSRREEDSRSTTTPLG